MSLLVIQPRGESSFDWRALAAGLDSSPRTRCLALAVTEAFRIGESGTGGSLNSIGNTGEYYRALAIGEVAAGLGRAGEFTASESLLSFPTAYIERRLLRPRFEDTKANLLDVLGRCVSGAIELEDPRPLTSLLAVAKKLAVIDGKGGYELLAPIRALVDSAQEQAAAVLLAAASPAAQSDLLATLLLTPAAMGGALYGSSAVQSFVASQLDAVSLRLDHEQYAALGVLSALRSEIDALGGAPAKRKAEIDRIMVPEIRGWALGAQAAGFLALPLDSEARLYLAEEPFSWMRSFIEAGELPSRKESEVWREFSLALLRCGAPEALQLARRAQENCDGLEKVKLEALTCVEELVSSGRLEQFRGFLEHRMLHLQQSDRILLCAEICSYAAARPGNFNRNAVAEIAVQQTFGPVPRLPIPPNIVDQIAGPLSKLGMCQLAASLMGPPREWGLFDFQRGAAVARRMAANGDVARGYELLCDIHLAAEAHLDKARAAHERAVNAILIKAASRAEPERSQLSPAEAKIMKSIADPEESAGGYRQRLLRTRRHGAERIKTLSAVGECYAAISCHSEAHALFMELSATAATEGDPRLHYVIAKHASRGNRPDRPEYFNWRRFCAERASR